MLRIAVVALAVGFPAHANEVGTSAPTIPGFWGSRGPVPSLLARAAVATGPVTGVPAPPVWRSSEGSWQVAQGGVDAGQAGPTAGSNATAPEPQYIMSPENLRAAIDAYLETRPGGSQIAAIEEAYGVSPEEARRLLQMVVDYHSSAAVQNSAARWEAFYQAGEDLSNATAELSKLALAALAAPAAASQGLGAVTLALIGVAASSYSLQGDVLVAEAKRRGDDQMLRHGKALQRAGNTLSTATYVIGRIDAPKLKEAICDGKFVEYVQSVASAELTEQAQNAIIEALKDPAKAAEFLTTLAIMEAMSRGAWGEAPPQPGMSVPASPGTGMPGPLIIPSTGGTDVPRVGPVPGSPPSTGESGLQGSHTANFGIGGGVDARPTVSAYMTCEMPQTGPEGSAATTTPPTTVSANRGLDFDLVPHVNPEKPVPSSCDAGLTQTVCNVTVDKRSCKFTFTYPGPDAGKMVPGEQFDVAIDAKYECNYAAGPEPAQRPVAGFDLSVKIGGFTFHVGGTPNAGWNGFGVCKAFIGASGGPYVSPTSVPLSCRIGVPPHFPKGGPYTVMIGAGDYYWAARWEVVPDK